MSILHPSYVLEVIDDQVEWDDTTTSFEMYVGLNLNGRWCVEHVPPHRLDKMFIIYVPSI